jgi:hypothetical protein
MSPAVLSFIFKYIDSIETIEILLFLRSVRNDYKNAEQISHQLRSNPSSVEKRLLTLKSHRLIVENLELKGRYKFDPENSEIEMVIHEFAEAYIVKPQRIFEILYSPNRQIREFADAFVIGRSKKKEDDDNG